MMPSIILKKTAWQRSLLPTEFPVRDTDMSTRPTSLCNFFLFLSVALFSWSAYGEQNPQTLPETLSLKLARSLELSAGGQTLTGGYASWRNVTLRGTYASGDHVLQGELSAKKEFGEAGNFVGVADTFTISPQWYASVGAGAGNGAFYLPRYRLDATLNRKWLARQNLVTSLGFGYYKAPDGHVDHGLNLSAAYYFDQPLVVEGGVRYNRSTPGAVVTHQQFLAATFGRDRRDLLSVRYGWGGEGYLTIAENTALVDFQSKEISLGWRHWIDSRTGFLADLNHYRNPFYERSGVNLAVFRQFK